MQYTSLLLAGISAISLNAISVNSNAEETESSQVQVELEKVVITTTREEKSIYDLSESIGVLDSEQLEQISPSHPAEALNRISGVYVNNLGGEGHMTSIRQPITTSGVYLFLEDGVPSRPTGFFNHNGLYEINIPQSSRIEVIKGPGSALYGSDAIGGVINSITKAPEAESGAGINVEAGSFGWQRALVTGTARVSEATAARVDYNYTKSDNFREEGDYDRNTLNLRFDSELMTGLTAKLLASYSEINQSGVSSLSVDEYRNDIDTNHYRDDIGFREVEALRVSSEFNYTLNAAQLLTFTPYYRKNTMDMMPSWMVTYDPNLREYGFESYGAQLKFRQNLFEKSELIVGIDTDKTPSTYRENQITVTKDGDDYVDYAKTGELNYDFNSTQTSVSPYMHSEFQLLDNLRLTAGIRYDEFSVKYDNHLEDQPLDFKHRRPDSQTIKYDNWSPKLGMVYAFANKQSAFVSYREAFRAPTVGALFRSGSSKETDKLNSVTSKSYEVGVRGELSDATFYEVAVYQMKVEDDIVNVIENGSRISRNAGETQHKGIELGVDQQLNQEVQLGLSFTYTEQTYESFSYVYFDGATKQNIEVNFKGNDVAKAPKTLGNLRVAYAPLAMIGFRTEVELVHMGEYYTDQTNTQKYPGHHLLNLRTSYDFANDAEVYLRVSNMTDARYSTYTSKSVTKEDVDYRPGSPRAFYAGVRYQF